MNHNNLNTTENQEEHKRKRWLLSMLLIFLLGLSATGVAFAYSTTYEISENPVVVEYFSIYLSDEDGAEFSSKITGDGKDIEVYSKKTDGIVEMFSDGTTFTREFYVNVETDKDCQYTVSVSITTDAVLNKLIEIVPVDDIIIDGNTPTKITANFNVKACVDLSTVGLTTDTTVRENVKAVAEEIQTHFITFSISATPVE